MQQEEKLSVWVSEEAVQCRAVGWPRALLGISSHHSMISLDDLLGGLLLNCSADIDHIDVFPRIQIWTQKSRCGLRYLYLAHPAPPGMVTASLPFTLFVAVLAAWHPSLEVPVLVLVAVVCGNRSWSWL